MNKRIQIVAVLVMCLVLAHVWFKGNGNSNPAGPIEAADVSPEEVKGAALEREAMSGNLEARRKLCSRWLGVGSVTADFKQAVRWCELAAQSGDAEAQVMMGQLYQRGRGVPLDAQVAKTWYEKAAAQGNVLAKQQLEKLGARQ